MEEHVIWVDEQDREVGAGEKLATHQKGQLHRAFSVVVFNSRNEMLLQRRAETKYHSGGLWSNTCCGHPRPGESVIGAARRRLMEELGIDCELGEVFSFKYEARLDHQMTENEYDHVLVGHCDDIIPNPNPDEVSEWAWMSPEDLRRDVHTYPQRYTYWFKILLERANIFD
ncbi:MAG: isopentenyl-diphosphate Delta-isomerase [Anaerolineae bacterium]|nr:isopentenyl-diphosphate Delta-isomerase [Anaerolineae bacterium]